MALLGATLLLGAGTAATYAYFAHDLPSPQGLTTRQQFLSTKIFDRNGVLLYEVYDPDRGRRTALKIADVPKPVVNAFLAAEDASFYQNPGVDVKGIARALFGIVSSRGERITGGSTITQQLVKNTLLTDERTLTRKIREAILALDISRRYSKDQILELYLNTSFFGNQANGLETAAQTYFAKPAANLSVGEAALLAGLVRSPSTTNPFADQEAAKAEQKRVLDAMVRHNLLSQQEADAAYAQPLVYNDRQFGDLRAPHFVLWVRSQLEANPKYGQQGLYERGLEITTTLDIRLQEMAERIVKDQVSRLGQLNVHDGALVAINPQTGEILAMVGSADYANKAIKGEVNVARALRQPGSAIKPITYLGAFLKGWSPATVIEDVETTFPANPPYTPKNYDGQFHGKVTARTALANSYNIPAVKTLQFLGVPGLIDLSGKMGISSFADPSKYGLALTLGGGEVQLLDLSSAYGVFAAGGQRVAPVSILKVADSSGKVLDQYAGPRPQPVVTPAQAYLITSILSDNGARTPGFGPNSPLKLSRPAAVKTGTTDDYKDNWTIGYTSQLVTGVWVGNADNTAMRGTTGLTGAAPIWHDFMEAALKPLPVDPLAPPPGLGKTAVGAESGKLWVEGCPEPKREEYFAPGTEPKEKCEAPTATPSPTAAPATSTPAGTATPRPASTALPSADELRRRIQETSTAAVAAAQAQLTQQAQARQQATRPNQPGHPGQPGQPTQSGNASQRSPTRGPAQSPSPSQDRAGAPTQPAATATPTPQLGPTNQAR
jgi:1A family penicillin-binding protein